ncbi:MAG: hypothetical protein ACLTEH_01780 [Clostridia bacterium]
MRNIHAKLFRSGTNCEYFWVKGMVKVKPFTDDISRFEELKEVYICQKKINKK